MLLTRNQWATLKAASDRIVPPDEDPGAWQAGVGDYLARQLGCGGLQDQADVYRVGLEMLDQEARAVAGQPFDALMPGQQDAVLARVESGQVDAPWAVDPARFFRMLVGHVMEGCYADPGNGGNRDQVSWRMIGFEVCG